MLDKEPTLTFCNTPSTTVAIYIATVVDGVLQKVNVGSLSSIDEVLDTDRQAREIAKSIVGAL